MCVPFREYLCISVCVFLNRREAGKAIEASSDE